MKDKQFSGRYKDIFNEVEYQLIISDTYNTLTKIDSERFDLIITSPPYNIGKEYEVKKSIESYLLDQEKVIYELVRVLSQSGSICWQVGNYVNKG